MSDREDVWSIFHAVVSTGDTYAFAPDTSVAVAADYFVGSEMVAFVAEVDGRVVGMYKLIPNRRDLGAHVANASFMVHPEAAGRGIGRALGDHCLRQARVRGFAAMQFNFVVSTNTRGVALWQSLGFVVMATLPNAFRHQRHGLVDAYVMFRSLDDIVPVFGAARPDISPIARPSAYALIYDEQRRVAVVRAGGGILLPGGGIDDGETPEEAAVRESAEECALEIRVVGPRGRAVQFVHARETKDCFEKHSTFFEATPVSTRQGVIPDHSWQWLSPAAAQWALTYPSHRWALNT